MDTERWEDTKDMAGRLEEMLETAPNNYYYVKGFIQALLVKNKPGQVSAQYQTNPEQLAGLKRRV